MGRNIHDLIVIDNFFSKIILFSPIRLLSWRIGLNIHLLLLSSKIIRYGTAYMWCLILLITMA